MKPGSGFRFRFPFPYEDEIPIGNLCDNGFQRGLAVTIGRGGFFEKGNFPDIEKGFSQTASCEVNPNNETETVNIEIVRQKLILKDEQALLVLAYRCPFCKEAWRTEEKPVAESIAGEITKVYRCDRG